MKKVTIIGAGLVGTVLAIFLSKKGYKVEIYEKREYLDHEPTNTGKSINLTLCTRGINVLKKIGLDRALQKICVPSYGRHLHLSNNTSETQPYGNYGEALYSVSRRKLNSLLLEMALKIPNISITFGVKCLGYDLSQSTISLIDKTQQQTIVPFNTLIAADGVYSAIRGQMQRSFGFNYSQFYSAHGNKELTITAEKAIEYKLKQNYLHIWPRNEFMIIAFPNPDNSFTCSLQLPMKDNEASFETLTSQQNLLYQFNKIFPSAIALIPNLINDFFQNPVIPMVTIRCSPWYVADKVLLIGDAAHGIWPSYGQGANAGFEDCEVLIDALTRHPGNKLAAFSEFQDKRKVNVDAIADLAENHYNEIRYLVTDPNFLFKKRIERKINLLFPSEYFSLYSRIAFTTMPYKEALELELRYSQIINELVNSPIIRSNPDSDESEKVICHSIKVFSDILRKG